MSKEPEDQQGPERSISWTSPEIVGELVLLAVVVFLAIVFVISLPDLSQPSRWLPIIAMTFAGPLVVLRLIAVVKRKRALGRGALMDIGFRVGEDPRAEVRRGAAFAVWIAGLFIGVWAIGFHIGLPLWVMAYLMRYSKLRIYGILIVGIAFVGFLFGILDYIINTDWFEPRLFRLAGVEYPFNEWPISGGF